jgi:hypothetical protein
MEGSCGWPSARDVTDVLRISAFRWETTSLPPVPAEGIPCN